MLSSKDQGQWAFININIAKAGMHSVFLHAGGDGIFSRKTMLSETSHINVENV